jgi:class 3 adenylate cyclase
MPQTWVFLIACALGMATSAELPDVLPPDLNGIPEPATVTSTNPATLTFGCVCSYTQLGCDVVSGLDAAFQEINDAGGIRGMQLRTAWRESPDFIGIAGTKNAIELITNNTVFGFGFLGWELSTAVQKIIQRHGIPNVSPMVADPAIVYSPDARNIINVRFVPDQELLARIGYAINANKYRCNSFGAFYVQVVGVDAFVNFVAGIFKDLGYPTRVIPVVYPDPTTYETFKPYLDAMYGNLTVRERPKCFIHLGDAPSILRWTDFIYTHPMSVPGTICFGASLTSPPGGVAKPDLAGGFEHYKDLYFSQLLPDPHSETSELAKSYRRATKNLRTHPMPGICSTYQPRYQQFEYYVSGRLIGEILTRTTTVTRENFLKAAYDTKLFQIDDVLLGPYSDHCVGGMTDDDMSCFCNAGGRSVYMSKIDTATGIVRALPDDTAAGEFGIAETKVSITRCSLGLEQITAPFLFGQVFAARDLDNPTTNRFRTALHEAMVGNNRHRVVEHKRLFFPSKVYNATDAAAAAAAVSSLVDYNKVLAFAGGTVSVEDVQRAEGGGYVVVDGLSSDVLRTVDPPYTTSAIYLVPSLADFVHTLASFATTFAGRPITILATTAEEANLGVDSLHTFQIRPTRTLVLPPLQLREWARGEVAALASSSVLLVVSQDRSTVSELILTHIANASSSVVWLVAASEELLGEVTQPKAQWNASQNVFFASSFDTWWRPDHHRSEFETHAAKIISTGQLYTKKLGASPSVTLDPTRLRASLLLLTLFTAAESITTRAKTPEQLQQWFFAAGEKSISGATIGPFSNAECIAGVPALRCRCNKGVQRFFVHKLADWTTANPSAEPAHSYTHFACRVRYEALNESSLNVLFVALLTTVLAVVVCAIVAIVVAYRTRQLRDNSAAPHDDTKPFAIVFTDIQASTTLWEKAPEDMARAVQIHHTEMRRLLEKHNGYEVKTIGDSFMIAFKSPHNAVSFGLDTQYSFYRSEWGTIAFDELYLEQIDARVRTEEPRVTPLQKHYMVSPALWNGIRVRIGIHYGNGSIQLDPVTKGYDYYGTVVNAAARVAGAANGGQVLISEAVWEAIFSGKNRKGGSTIPPDAVVRKLGQFHLRGLADPMTLMDVSTFHLASRHFFLIKEEIDVEIPHEPSRSHTTSMSTTPRDPPIGTDNANPLGLFR